MAQIHDQNSTVLSLRFTSKRRKNHLGQLAASKFPVKVKSASGIALSTL